MKYSDIINNWIEARSQKTPEGMKDIQFDKNVPSAFMKPEDMMAALHAISPYDLVMKPDSSPSINDYPTSAFNIDNKTDGKVGIPSAILMASETPKRELLKGVLRSVSDEADRSYNDKEKPYAASGIYEHEKAHFNDPRMNPMANNYGYIVRSGLQGNIASREIPAMRAEDRMFGKLFDEGKLR